MMFMWGRRWGAPDRHPGEGEGPAVIRVPVSGTRPFTLKIASRRPLVLPDGRYVSIRALPPVFDRAVGEPATSDA